jgi:hypothetical protein
MKTSYTPEYQLSSLYSSIESYKYMKKKIASILYILSPGSKCLQKKRQMVFSVHGLLYSTVDPTPIHTSLNQRVGHFLCR